MENKKKKNNEILLLEDILSMLIDNWNNIPNPDDAMQESINAIRHMIKDRTKEIN